MSYQRSPHPLSRFYSISEYYVYHDRDRVDDLGATYHHNPSFCQLIGDLVLDATHDSIYSAKIVRILSKKLKCDHLLRSNGFPVDYMLEYKLYSKILHEFPMAFDLIIHLSAFNECSEIDSVLAESHLLDSMVDLHLNGPDII